MKTFKQFLKETIKFPRSTFVKNVKVTTDPGLVFLNDLAEQQLNEMWYGMYYDIVISHDMTHAELDFEERFKKFRTSVSWSVSHNYENIKLSDLHDDDDASSDIKSKETEMIIKRGTVYNVDCSADGGPSYDHSSILPRLQIRGRELLEKAFAGVAEVNHTDLGGDW